MGEVYADADHHRVIGAFEEDAGELGAIEEQIVRPFYDCPRAFAKERKIGGDDLFQRDCGNQR
jgi:hypothetical protein